MIWFLCCFKQHFTQATGFYLWNVVSPFLADSVEPSKSKQSLRSHNTSSFTKELWSPGIKCSQQVLFDTRGSLK